LCFDALETAHSLDPRGGSSRILSDCQECACDLVGADHSRSRHPQSQKLLLFGAIFEMQNRQVKPFAVNTFLNYDFLLKLVISRCKNMISKRCFHEQNEIQFTTLVEK
jgi:hypothetical protein